MTTDVTCRTYNGFDINFTADYFKDKVLLPTLQNYKNKIATIKKLEEKIEQTGEEEYKSLLKKVHKLPILPLNELYSGNQKDGRGNIAPETIILPTIAMMAKKKCKNKPEEVVDVFMELLKKELVLTRTELIERYNWVCAQPPHSATFMWENNTMKGYEPDQGIRSALRHGTLVIGQIGIAETLQILIGCDHTTKKGMELAKKIEQLYKDFCAQSKEELKLNFGNYMTPAESTAGAAAKYFTKKHGLIENVTAYKDTDGSLKPRGYFTNSIHVPVWIDIDPYKKIDIESELTGYSNAGCITYVEIGDNAENNIKELEHIVLYAKKKDIPYFALNVKLSSCNKCGYFGYIPRKEPCPVCGADHDTYVDDFARITGYLSRTVKHFNDGKQSEEGDRFVHVNKLTEWQTCQGCN